MSPQTLKNKNTRQNPLNTRKVGTTRCVKTILGPLPTQRHQSDKGVVCMCHAVSMHCAPADTARGHRVAGGSRLGLGCSAPGRAAPQGTGMQEPQGGPLCGGLHSCRGPAATVCTPNAGPSKNPGMSGTWEPDVPETSRASSVRGVQKGQGGAATSSLQQANAVRGNTSKLLHSFNKKHLAL